jgi:hypothetical protein
MSYRFVGRRGLVQVEPAIGPHGALRELRRYRLQKQAMPPRQQAA